MRAKAFRIPFTAADDGSTTGKMSLPGGSTLCSVSLGVASGTVPPTIAAIWVRSSDEGSTINHGLQTGHIYLNGSPGGKITWDGKLPLPEDRGEITIRGIVLNRTGSAIAVELSCIVEEPES